MRRKTVRLTACALLSLLFVFGVVAALRRADRRLPLNPIAAAETITAAENTRETAASAPVPSETTAPPQDEPTTRARRTSGRTPNTVSTEPVTAFSRGSAAVLGTDVPDGAPRLRSDGKSRGTGFDGEINGDTVPTTDAPALNAGNTAAVPETTSVPVTAPTQPYRAPTASGRAAQTEPATKPEEPTSEKEKREPVTDLTDRLLAQSELPEGELRFRAYLKDDTDGYSLRVTLTRADGSRTRLYPTGTTYHTPLPLGVHYITMTVSSDGETVSYQEYRVEIVADKATDENPQVGDAPPVIETNLDGWTDEIVNNRFTLRVTAHTAKGTPIRADGVEVRLDDSLIYDPTGSGALEYALFFAAPTVGETEKHTVTVLAWDGEGNSAFKSYEIVYRHVSDGDRTGKVTVILDATAVGLGVLDAETVDVHQGENAAQLLLRVLDDFDYSYDHAGSVQSGFYLRRIARDGMCDDAQVPDALWTLILRDEALEQGKTGCPVCGADEYLIPNTVLPE